MKHGISRIVAALALAFGLASFAGATPTSTATATATATATNTPTPTAVSRPHATISGANYNSGVYMAQGGGGLVVKQAAGPGILSDNGAVVWNARFHVLTAEVNAGAIVLPAIPGWKYRLIGCKAIAIGGAAGTATSVDVEAFQSTSLVHLVVYGQSALTQSTVLPDGASGATVLADGATYAANDANKPIIVRTVGSALDTATAIDFIISYSIES